MYDQDPRAIALDVAAIAMAMYHRLGDDTHRRLRLLPMPGRHTVSLDHVLYTCFENLQYHSAQLRSTVPPRPPIDPNADQRDVDRLLKGYRRGGKQEDILVQRALLMINYVLLPEVVAPPVRAGKAKL